ncbi:MAG: glutamyl-tRNA reductase, partial [Deltaproteobacteria bacterium]|nr:glutamyl-tRNA reductase [Deltaproteobacteria bacterium]
LNFAFQQAFRIAKQIRTQTGIARFPVSVSTVSLMLLEQIFGDFKEVTALVVGLGEMGRQTAELLKERGVQKLIIMNRTYQRAREFASVLKAEACPLDALTTVLPLADMVVASTAAPSPILMAQTVQEALAQRKERPMVLMDLGFPRDIAPDAAHFENAYLYNVDDLKEIADKNLSQRQKEAKRAEEIINKSLLGFESDWMKRTLQAYQKNEFVFENP